MIAPDPDLRGDLDLEVGPYALRPVQESDAADLFAEFSDPRVVEYMDMDPLTDPDQAFEIVAWAASLRARGAGLRWGIRDHDSGDWVGTCGFNTLMVERGRRGEVAYDLAAAWQGRGVMARVLPAIIDVGFGRLALHRLEAMVTPGQNVFAPATLPWLVLATT